MIGAAILLGKTEVGLRVIGAAILLGKTEVGLRMIGKDIGLWMPVKGDLRYGRGICLVKDLDFRRERWL